MSHTFKVGDVVALKSEIREYMGQIPADRKDHKTATVMDLTDTYYENGLLLDRDLGGCQLWKSDEVELVKE